MNAYTKMKVDMQEYRLWPVLTIIIYLSYAGLGTPGRYLLLLFAFYGAYRTVQAATKEFLAFRSSNSVKYLIYLMIIAYFSVFARANFSFNH